MDTIQEILHNRWRNQKLLTLQKHILEHGKYSKATDIIMNDRNIDLRSIMNLKMRGFRATCIVFKSYWKTICGLIRTSGSISRFTDAERKDYNNQKLTTDEK